MGISQPSNHSPQYLLDKLQKVQNAAARLVWKAKKSDHIHPILETLHWLPVTHRIQHKISTICFNSISGTAPRYLSDLLQLYTPARQLRSASDTRTFVTPPPPPPPPHTHTFPCPLFGGGQVGRVVNLGVHRATGLCLRVHQKLQEVTVSLQ